MQCDWEREEHDDEGEEWKKREWEFKWIFVHNTHELRSICICCSIGRVYFSIQLASCDFSIHTDFFLSFTSSISKTSLLFVPFDRWCFDFSTWASLYSFSLCAQCSVLNIWFCFFFLLLLLTFFSGYNFHQPISFVCVCVRLCFWVCVCVCWFWHINSYSNRFLIDLYECTGIK